MKLTDLHLKVEIRHDERDTPERLAQEICRKLLKIYGVQAAELSSFVSQDDPND
jgi:hypothetical protein